MVSQLPSWPVQLADALGLAPLPEGLGLRAVHRWHAGTVLPALSLALGLDLTELCSAELAASHGGNAIAGDWRRLLEPMLHAVLERGYDSAGATARSRHSAAGYARANSFSTDETEQFADGYARLNVAASRSAYARAAAGATAGMIAQAYAEDDNRAYAAAGPYALARAYRAVLPGVDLAAGLRH